MFEITRIHGGEDLQHIRVLFTEYAESLGFSLDFQDFHLELEKLPGKYAEPEGALFLAKWQGKPAGCNAVCRFGGSIGELKRLYVKPEYRGKGIGRSLAKAAIKHSSQIGYKKIRLDTIDNMVEAIGLYESLGFVEIEPYRYNPFQNAVFMELSLV